jgi:hypothetical protein
MEQKKNFNKKKVRNKNMKKEPIFIQPTQIRAGEMYEYKMPVAMYDEYVKDAKKEKASGNIQQYLCNIVNEQFGLLGTCVRVIVG